MLTYHLRLQSRVLQLMAIFASPAFPVEIAEVIMTSGHVSTRMNANRVRLILTLFGLFNVLTS